MLIIILPLATLPILSNSWFISSSFILILTALVSILYSNPYSWVLTSRSLFSLDLIRVSLIILTLWISRLIILARNKIKFSSTFSNYFIISCLLLRTLLILTFSSRNLLLFYILFERSLVPIIILILTWGYQPERLQARIYLMLYTLTASLPILIIIFLIFTKNHHLSLIIPHWGSPLPEVLHYWWYVLIMAFLVKIPLFSLHLWLPKAHVEAPVAGSIILAGVLLKLGTYGLIRISSIFPQINKQTASIIIPLALWGAVITSLICIRQTDLKSLIAYSSIGHIGILLAGVLSSTEWGWQGALAIIIAHGLSSSALFLLANTTYEVTQTRSIFLTKGIINIFPSISLWWFICCSVNIAAPPSINLLREILLITGTLSCSPLLAIFLIMSRFLTAIYSLFIFAATQHGICSSLNTPLSSKNFPFFLNIILHSAPIFFLIIKPDLICNWL